MYNAFNGLLIINCSPTCFQLLNIYIDKIYCFKCSKLKNSIKPDMNQDIDETDFIDSEKSIEFKSIAVMVGHQNNADISDSSQPSDSVVQT